MRKIIAFIALLIAAAFVCGCSVPFMSTSVPHPTQTAVIPDQTTDEPTYTPLPIPSAVPITPTPRAEQSFAISNIKITWKTNAGTESDTVTFNIDNDGAQTLTGLSAKYTVGVFTAMIYNDNSNGNGGEVDSETPHWVSSDIGTLKSDESKAITMSLSGPNGAYSNEKPGNASLVITWDGGSKTIFKKSLQNPDYSNGVIDIDDSDLYVAPPSQSGVVN